MHEPEYSHQGGKGGKSTREKGAASSPARERISSRILPEYSRSGRPDARIVKRSRGGGATKSGELSKAALAFHGMMSAVAAWLLLTQLGLIWLIPGLRGQTIFLVLAAALGALMGMTVVRYFLHGLTLLALGLWLVVCLSPLAACLARPLTVSSPAREADAVVVLSSSMQRDGDFSDVALARFLGGLQLVRSKFAPRLVLTELPPPSGSNLRAAKSLTARLGIHCAFETVGPVRDTHDEAMLVARLARARGWKRILLVTSPVHSRRALLTFRKAGLSQAGLGRSSSGKAPHEAGLQVISTPCRETGYDLENLPTPGDRLRAFAAVIHEHVGLRIYRSRGWT